MLLFGAVQIVMSQIPDFHNMGWLSVIAAIMSFTYSFIGFGLGVAKVIGIAANLSSSFFLLIGIMLCYKDHLFSHLQQAALEVQFSIVFLRLCIEKNRNLTSRICKFLTGEISDSPQSLESPFFWQPELVCKISMDSPLGEAATLSLKLYLCNCRKWED